MAEITAPCVLHAGDSHSLRREVFQPGGKSAGVTTAATCSFNAECVWKQGKATVGDGDVGLECVDKACTCSRRLLASSAPPTKFRFEADVSCATTEEGQRLLVEHCLKGLKVERR